MRWIWAILPLFVPFVAIGEETVPVLAAPPAGEETEAVSLSAALDETLRTHPSLRALGHRWRAALEKVPQARALPDPWLTYEALTRVETPEHRIGFRQEIPVWTALRAAGEEAAGEARAAGCRFEAGRQSALYATRAAHAACVRLGLSLRAGKASLELLRGLEPVVRARYAAADASHPDLLRLQNEIARLESDLDALEAMRPVLGARLAAALGRDPSGPALRAQEETFPAELPALAPDVVLARVARANPEIGEAEAMTEAAIAARRAARVAWLPGLSLGACSMRMEGGPMERNYPVEAMVELSLPLQAQRIRAGERGAEEALRAARSERKAALHRLLAEARAVLYAVQDADRRARLVAGELAPRQERAAEALTTAYAAGAADLAEALGARREVLQLKAEEIDALAERETRLAELGMLGAADFRSVGAAP